MKKIIYIVLLSVIVLGFSECKKFLDINTNPNNPTEESVSPNLILSSSLKRMADQMATGYAVQARWMGYWSRSGSYGPNPDEEAYQLTSSFGTGSWSTWFDIMNDVHIMGKKANDLGEDFYSAAAKTLKTIGFMYLVDIYNNVPYSETFHLTVQKDHYIHPVHYHI
jgi:hypothetical protein